MYIQMYIMGFYLWQGIQSHDVLQSNIPNFEHALSLLYIIIINRDARNFSY
jgi:hypothetical protein